MEPPRPSSSTTKSQSMEGKEVSKESGGKNAEGSGRRPAEASGVKNQGFLWEWTKSILIAGALFLLLRTFVLGTFVIISGSMESTLLVGDLLLVNRAAMGSRIPGTPWRVPGYSEPKRGDVVVFDPHHEVDMKLVKRLVGLPGDTLQMRGKGLLLNGELLAEPYVRHTADGEAFFDRTMMWQMDHLLPEMDRRTYSPTRDDWGPIVIPEGHYFMLGDNRDESLDSRYWGPLGTWRVEGRASRIYFSYNRRSLRPFPWLREIRWERIGDRAR